LLPAAAGAYGARRGAGKPAAKSPLRGGFSLRPELRQEGRCPGESEIRIVRDAYFAIGAVMLATIAVRWSLGRMVEHLDLPLAAAQVIVVRVCTGLICALATAQAVTAGGLWLLVLPVFVLLAPFSFALAGGFIWLWARNGLSEDTRAPR